MHFMDIDGAQSTAAGAISPEDILDLAIENVGWNLLADPQDVSALATLVIAKALVALSHAAKKDRGAAIAALSHI